MSQAELCCELLPTVGAFKLCWVDSVAHISFQHSLCHNTCPGQRSGRLGSTKSPGVERCAITRCCWRSWRVFNIREGPKLSREHQRGLGVIVR